MRYFVQIFWPLGKHLDDTTLEVCQNIDRVAK